jgi:large subunit ribosomal protein L35
MPSRPDRGPERRPGQRAGREKESQMPKLKTKSSTKGRFRRTASGKLRANGAFKRHNLRKRSKKMRRKARGTMILADVDARIVKTYMPYG